MNYKWKYAPPSPEEEEAARKLGGELGIHPVLARLLQDRCITNVPEAKKFFHPQLSDLHDPFLMNDMDVAVDAINGVIGRGERILVFGDYDVDGCTAVTVVYSFLRHYSTNIGYYIPDRYDEGYGLSKRCIDDAAATRVKLMIVLDCGIKSIEEVAYANSLGIDVIICDHHVPDPELPAALAVLNPKRKDSTYPYSHLSGCGVGFKLMQAFAQNNGIAFNKLIPLLDLCVISIAGDIVPVTGENRILAYHGLRRLNSCPSTGVQAIIELCSLEGKELTMNDIVFSR